MLCSICKRHLFSSKVLRPRPAPESSLRLLTWASFLCFAQKEHTTLCLHVIMTKVAIIIILMRGQFKGTSANSLTPLLDQTCDHNTPAVASLDFTKCII